MDVPDVAPDRALPPVKSSSLQMNARRTARAATVHANEAFDPKSETKPAPPKSRRIETTLGALAVQLSEGLDESQAFDPGTYLRRRASHVQRRTGAGLAGAALKKLGGGR